MNFKKGEIVSTEKNYDNHIFMHPSEDGGSQGFSIKKRKSLSDEERREIEMQVTTGKVNQLGLEKSYFENYARDDHHEEAPERHQHRRPRDDNKFKKQHNHRDKKKFDPRNNNRKKSFLGSIFSAFTK